MHPELELFRIDGKYRLLVWHDAISCDGYRFQYAWLASNFCLLRYGRLPKFMYLGDK